MWSDLKINPPTYCWANYIIIQKQDDEKTTTRAGTKTSG
jgi:hypothetical protein